MVVKLTIGTTEDSIIFLRMYIKRDLIVV